MSYAIAFVALLTYSWAIVSLVAVSTFVATCLVRLSANCYTIRIIVKPHYRVSKDYYIITRPRINSILLLLQMVSFETCGKLYADQSNFWHD